MPPKLNWPQRLGKDRGPGYWLRPGNLWDSRRVGRTDHSNEWRYENLRISSPLPPPSGCDPDPEARSRSYTWLLNSQPPRPDRPPGRFRCVILGDTGEGDYSQYALVPIIRYLKPDFMIVNGDVAYPSGKSIDYTEGFFQPYKGLGIPVWALPGNHDYYSKTKGREFYEIFCTEVKRKEWDDHGLVSKPQPGTYWELSEPGVRNGLVILGVDTGHSADLDGLRGAGLLGLFGKPQGPDSIQHRWLHARLRRAQETNSKVVLLYHIPALVSEKHVDKVHLTTLHRIIAQYPCVRLVVTAHEHNYQRYDPPVFARYLSQEYQAAAAAPPTYLVSGAGGAYITASDFDDGVRTGYVTASRYPTADDWRKWAPGGLRLLAKAGLDKNALKKVAIGLIKIKTKLAEESDADRPERLSLLVLDYDPGAGPTVQPYFIEDLSKMYGYLAPDTPISVQEGDPAIDPASERNCLVDPVIRL
jgi:hypothetical protein